MFLIKRTHRFIENSKVFDSTSTSDWGIFVYQKFLINNNKKRFFVEEFFFKQQMKFLFFHHHSYRLRIYICHLITKNHLNNYRVILNRREEFFFFFFKKCSWIKFLIIFRTWKWFQCKKCTHIYTRKRNTYT